MGALVRKASWGPRWGYGHTGEALCAAGDQGMPVVLLCFRRGLVQGGSEVGSLNLHLLGLPGGAAGGCGLGGGPCWTVVSGLLLLHTVWQFPAAWPLPLCGRCVGQGSGRCSTGLRREAPQCCVGPGGLFRSGLLLRM